MSKDKKNRIDVSGESAFFSENPFNALDAIADDLPVFEKPVSRKEVPNKVHKKGRVDVSRVVGGRNGKTVTLTEGEAFLSESEQALKKLANKLKTACGAGGTVKDQTIEIQGDNRDVVSELLKKEGYRVVLAGG